jgi:hypothetical protein
MKFRPVHNRVVLKRIDAEDKTAGGIIIPDTAKEKPSEGELQIKFFAPIFQYASPGVMRRQAR